VPPTSIQELRDLTRTRKQLVREVARHTQRIQKTLEDANIKIESAICASAYLVYLHYAIDASINIDSRHRPRCGGTARQDHRSILP
jgi:hypothetical protein